MLVAMTPPPAPSAPSDPAWVTFGPDVLAGIISALTAGLIVGIVFFLLQRWSERRTAREHAISAAYDGLLESLGRVIMIDPRKTEDLKILTEMAHRMLVLSELVDMQTPEFAIWMEAERRRAGVRVSQALERLTKLGRAASADEQLEARRPFLEWARDFTNDVRRWRMGKVTGADMRKLATEIESTMREAGEWFEPTKPGTSEPLLPKAEDDSTPATL